MVMAHSSRLNALMKEAKDAFTGYATAFSALSVRKAHVAPIFMKAYRAWHKETGRTFVAFVQQLDPTVPSEKPDYVNHRSFQAALYLRRLDEAPETASGHRKNTMTPLAVLAVVVRSSVDDNELDFAISEIKRVSGWHTRDVDRLRDRVAKSKRIALHPNQPRLRRSSSHFMPRSAAADRSSAHHVH